jgi:hypothetical protein
MPFVLQQIWAASIQKHRHKPPGYMPHSDTHHMLQVCGSENYITTPHRIFEIPAVHPASTLQHVLVKCCSIYL